MVTGHENGTITVFDFQDDRVLGRLRDAHENSISCLVFSISALNLISGAHDG